MCTHLIFPPTFNPGPIAGDPFPALADSPPAVIPEFFDQVCPSPTIIDRREVNAALSDPSAATILQAWLDKLERTEDRCVEIKGSTGQIFDFMCVCSAFLLQPYLSDFFFSFRGKKAIW